MTLLTQAKPAVLPPQQHALAADPAETEGERAGPRRVRPEQGSKAALRQSSSSAAAAERQGRAPGRSVSPCPSSFSSSSSSHGGQTHHHQPSSAIRDGSATPTLSSSSSVRTPSPANSLNHPATPSSSSSSAVQPAPAPAGGYQYFSTVSLMLEEPHAALPKALWKADADADVCDREACNVRFGMFTARKHHCRKCGLIFCSACTAESHPLLFPRTLASALTSPLQSRNTSPSSSYTTITHPLPAASSSSSSTSRPPTPPPSSENTPTATPSSEHPKSASSLAAPSGAATPATPTRQVALVTSRVCLDCKKSLSSPASMRPTIASRRSSARSALRLNGPSGPSSGGSSAAGGGGQQKEQQPLHTLADAIALSSGSSSSGGVRSGLDSPDYNGSFSRSSSQHRNRSLSPSASLFPAAGAGSSNNTSPRLSSAHAQAAGAGAFSSTASLPRLNLSSMPSPSTSAFTPALTGPLSTRSPAATPHEPWMDGPLGEFPLAYPRREGPVFDPNVHCVVRSRSQLRMKGGRSREGSLAAGSVKEEDGEDATAGGRPRWVTENAHHQPSPPSSQSTSPETASTSADLAAADACEQQQSAEPQAAAAQSYGHKWSTF